MDKVILILMLTLSNCLFAQGNYEEGMSKAFQLWDDGKADEASAYFERIAAADKENWLPNYYVTLVNTTEAFKTKDSEQVNTLLTKAQSALDMEMDKDPNNVELLVLQAMIHTAWIAFDPMTNGQKLSGKVVQLYAQAEIISPKNPRVLLSKAQFEMGSAQFFGTDIQPICDRIEHSIILFDNFKPETPFHPNWGKKEAEEVLKSCKNI
jgi:hypothetical protein